MQFFSLLFSVFIAIFVHSLRGRHTTRRGKEEEKEKKLFSSLSVFARKNSKLVSRAQREKFSRAPLD
jgi:hypothetical protein